MKNHPPISTGKAGLLAGAALLVVLTGCAPQSSGQGNVAQASPAVPPPSTVVIQDDYEYYPGYETYYSRNRHEYVYRDGNAWVRRSEPRGIAVNVLLAAPSVRMDFHDSPEQHHNTVVRSYPKDWKRPDQAHDDRKNDRKPGDK